MAAAPTADFQAGIPGTVAALRESQKNLSELSAYCKQSLAQGGDTQTVAESKQFCIDALVSIS